MSECPQPCEHLSQEDAREGRTCSEHPCACDDEREALHKAALEEVDRREEYAEAHGHPAFQDEASAFIDGVEWAAGLRCTPTDDEREALDYAIRCAIPNDLDYRPLWKLIRAIQDAVLAAGFRRSEVPEPSADDPMSHYTDPTDPFWQSSPEPQGEPSDAQVEAALIAHLGYDPSPAGFPFLDGEKDQMRAALRAAGGAR